MNLSKEDLGKINELLEREPTLVEKYVFDTMWSEHCSYKSSKPILKTLPTKGSEVVLGVGEDSGIIHFTEHQGKKYGLAVSHESHNHPSQILPVEGAATGVGGVIRDVYCMGADVIGVLDSLHFGMPGGQDTALVEEIADEVVKGVSDYGNPLGVPVLGGETIYHESYNENCLVNVAAVGILKEDQIIRSRTPKEAKHEPYDVILIGKSTDSTGFGGASFASTILDSKNEMQNIGAVQVHDPFLKRVLVEAIKVLLKTTREKKIPIGFKDLGAGGISCAASELAVAGGYGVDIDLDMVNTAIENLAPEVIACSETQERFCLIAPSYFTKDVQRIFNEEFEIPRLYPKAGAYVIGKVIQEPRFKMFYQGKIVCDLPVEAITTEVLAKRESEPREIIRTSKVSPNIETQEIPAICEKILCSLNSSSKRYVYRYYDNAVRGDTVIYPGEADAVVITPIKDCKAGVAVSIDSNVYGNADPWVSGAAAVAESVRNIIAVGAKPIALTDCLNYGNPEVPSVFFDFQEGVRGIGDAAKALSFIEGEPVPIISGNVSFYNESKQGNAIVPSPVILCVGKIDDFQKALTMQIRKTGSNLILIGRRYSEFGGTQFGVQGITPPALRAPLSRGEGENGIGNVAPQVRLGDEAGQNKVVYSLIQEEKLLSCHDISAGGLWITLCEMVLGERGLSKAGLNLELPQEFDPATALYSENSGYVVEVGDEDKDEVRRRLREASVDFYELGKTTEKKEIIVTHNNNQILSFPIPKIKNWANSKNLTTAGTPV